MDDPISEKRGKGKRLILKAAILIALLIALFYAEEDWRGAHEWAQFKREWAAKGENLESTTLIPPAVPDDKNFAMAPIVVSSYAAILDEKGRQRKPYDSNVVNRLAWNLNRSNEWNTSITNGEWEKGTLTDLSLWQAYYRAQATNGQTIGNEFPIAPRPQSPAADVLLALSKYNAEVEELREASRLLESRFPLAYDQDNPATILLPHLAAERRCVLFLQLRSIAEMQLGKTDKAADDIKLMFRMTEASHREPCLISQLVRIAILNNTLQPIYEGLARHKWSDVQLAEFDVELSKLDFLADYQISMRGEAAFSAKLVDYLQRTRKMSTYLGEFDSNQNKSSTEDFFARLFPSGWFHQNQIGFSDFYLRDCLPVADPQKREFYPAAAKKAQDDLGEAMRHPGPDNLLMYTIFPKFKELIGDANSLAKKFAYGQESTDLARVAIALERFRIIHGIFPQSLHELNPQFIARVPNDVIGGLPLIYRLTNGSFVLYSVGWNGQDDGGTPTPAKNGLPDSDEGDWVWQYPAK